MSNLNFNIHTHHIHGQHLREYAQGVADENVKPLIEVKHYVPIRRQPYGDYAVTLIAFGGIGFIKEVYEPLFDDLLDSSSSAGYAIRGIWIADMHVVGKSALLNRDNLGNTPSWWDHARDMLCMINHFSQHMPRPLIGLGHSAGGAQLAYLSLFHPRLFTSLILIEPAIYRDTEHIAILSQAKGMAKRREIWPTQEAARAAFAKSPFYKSWDPRALQALLDNSFSESSITDINKSSSEVQTTTPKHMEVALILKPNFHAVGVNDSGKITAKERAEVPDFQPAALWTYPFYRAEPVEMFTKLPFLRPSVLYILGADSPSLLPDTREALLRTTGTGPGGSGGIKEDKVKTVAVSGGQHTIPMDAKLPEVVRAANNWIGREFKSWKVNEEAFQSDWASKSHSQKASVDPVTIETFLEWKPGESIEGIVEEKMKSKL